jgi:diacylglycerol kinase family enzyme
VRALLVVNPKATTTTERTRDVLVHALSSDLKLDLVATQHRGHALELARQARRDRLDVVVTLGGDGTVNEVVNGLLEDGPGPDVPALALVPGGSANVLARALGLPPDPVEATGQLLEAIAEERTRAIGLGTADDRWFTFCAGLGLDAEVIAAVERARARGVRATPALYVRSAIREFFRSTDRDDPLLTLEAPGQDPVHEIFLAIVQSTSPWTYLGGLPVNPCPQASFDTALDLVALRSLGVASTLRHVRQILTPNGVPPRGRDVVALHDVAEFTLYARRPVAFQLDGDHLGQRTSITCRDHPQALRMML